MYPALNLVTQLCVLYFLENKKLVSLYLLTLTPGIPQHGTKCFTQERTKNMNNIDTDLLPSNGEHSNSFSETGNFEKTSESANNSQTEVQAAGGFFLNSSFLTSIQFFLFAYFRTSAVIARVNTKCSF